MTTKTLSPESLAIIDAYLHFKIGNAVASVPYFNNKTVRSKGGLRVMVGKGSPKDIHEEVQGLAVKRHLDTKTLADESLKKFLVDSGIGIDCSGFAYYVLEAESVARGHGKLNRHLSFVHSYGPMGKMICYLRPVENSGVTTIASERNSRLVNTDVLMPGDFISMLSGTEDAERNHILVIHAVDNDNGKVSKIYYSHAISYPEDGIYGTGIKQGSISFTQSTSNILDQEWSDPVIHSRARSSKTELRRLKWL